MTSVINNFTVTNAALGKFAFNWSISGQTPQKISIIIYSDSGYTIQLYTFSTDSTVSSSGIVDFLVTAASFTMGANNPTLSNATTYYPQIYVIPYGIQTVTTNIYLNNSSNPITSIYPATILPINYAVYLNNSIGAYFGNGSLSLYMSVLIVNFAVYNRILTSAEINNYFNNSIGLISYTTALYNPIAIKMTSFYQSVANFPSYLYFDADSLNQMQGYFPGSSVATWCNLGSEVGTVINARGAFIGGTYLPTLQQTSTANNSRYYVQFTGTGTTVGNYFTLPPLQMTNAGFTIIFVANIASSAAGYNTDPVIDFGDNFNTANIIIGRNGTSSQLNFSFYNSGSLVVNQTTTYSTSLDGTWRIYAIRINNIHSFTSYYSWFYNNGSGSGTGLVESGVITNALSFTSYQSLNYSNPVSSSGCYIGRSNNTSRSMSNMQLGEFLLFRNTLSDTSINAIISIMEKRWNLDTPRTNIDFEVTQNVATFPSIDNSSTPKTIVANANATMVNDPIRGYVMYQYATIGSSSYNIAASYTKMCWIYLQSSISSATQIISSANTASSGIHSMFYNSINNISAGHSVGTTQTIYVTDPQTTPIGIWTHFTVCYENASGAASGYAQYTMTLYRNGIQVAQVTNAGMSWSGGSANTGVIFGNGSGYLDKPRIYSRALKQTEIQVIFNSEKQTMPIPVYYNAAGSYVPGTITATSSGTPTSSGTTISWTNNSYPAGTSLTITNTNGPNVTILSITPGTQQTQAITFTSSGSCTLTFAFTNQASVNIYGSLSAIISLTVPVSTVVHIVASSATPTSISPTPPTFGATYVTFPGANQYLNFGAITIPLGSVGFSVKIKIAWTSYNNWARVIDFNNGSSGVQDMFITLPERGNILRFQYKENSTEQQCDCSSNPISLNTVYNIAIVYDPTIGTIGQVSIWINGALVTLTDRRTLKGTDKTYANTYIGKSSYGGDAYLAAQVYQLDIYPYPITSTLASTLL
jgi:hypothetical protein